MPKAPESRASRPVSAELLVKLYCMLQRNFGAQHWWPAETQFEVMVGAILTQNASWGNVELAIGNLRRANALNPTGILAMRPSRLQRLIRPSGFFRVKEKRLRSFVGYFVDRYQAGIERMRRLPVSRLRPELLAVYGVGQETADSILLYALNKPVFVVDSYTRRILSRHDLIEFGTNYEEVRALFEGNLPRRVRLYNEYHALLVRLAKTFCRTRPSCNACPARPVLGRPVW